jgi:type IV pilus assembly protein PilN
VLIIGAAVGVYLWHSAMQDELRVWRMKVSETRAEIEQLKSKIGEVETYTRKKEELQTKLDVIDQLRKGKTGPVRMLDDLSQIIPKKVHLSSFDEGGGSVDFKGEAESNDEVALFMTALDRSPYFTGIRLVQIKATKHKDFGFDYVTFHISARVNYTANKGESS